MRLHLTTLNCGMGRDSLSMLGLLAEGRLLIDGVPSGPDAVDAVLFADTGAEWPHTYALLPRVRAWCVEMGVPFYHLAKPAPEAVAMDQRPKGSRDLPPWATATTIEDRCATGYYHRRRDIIGEYQRAGTIAVRSAANCTDNHKVQPMRRLLGDLCVERFGVDLAGWGRLVRRGLAVAHLRLIGFTLDELDRADPRPLPAYERLGYPLIEAMISKADEAEILERHGFDDIEAPVLKSGCFICPWQTAGWFWALSVAHPDLFAVAVTYERTALVRHPKMVVCGGSPALPLPEAVAAWRQRNPGATVEAVLRKDYVRGCRAAAPGQEHLLDAPNAPPRHHLVQRLYSALSGGATSPELYERLGLALSAAGLSVTAAQARDAAALARVAMHRPAAVVEQHTQLELGISRQNEEEGRDG